MACSSSSAASRGRLPVMTYLRRQRWRRRGTLAALAVALVLVSWGDHRGWLLHAPESPRGAELARYDGLTCRVVRVVDGDTLDVAAPDGPSPTTRVRLWGIDTPELDAEPLAAEAAALARELAEGQVVRLTLEPHRLRGHYGRVLAFVELPDGTLLNEALLLAGLARADDRWPHRHQDRFDLLELQAQRDAVGLWLAEEPRMNADGRR